MSSLARQLLGATGALTTVTGSVFGSGSLAIPAGVVLVTLAGQGGTGGDNSYYDPGQPYVAASWAGHWVGSGSTSIPYSTDNSTGYPSPPTAEGQTAASWSCSYVGAGVNGGFDYTCTIYYFDAVADSSTPGQPYIAPSSGGGVYSGGNTTATLNSITDTWTGGYGGVATSSVQTLVSTGAGQTLTYSIASGGSLNYSYTY